MSNLGDGASPTGRELTFGEKAVRHNPLMAKTNPVFQIKGAFAAIIDELNDKKMGPAMLSQETAREISIAITQAEIACMCAVKAIT